MHSAHESGSLSGNPESKSSLEGPGPSRGESSRDARTTRTIDGEKHSNPTKTARSTPPLGDAKRPGSRRDKTLQLLGGLLALRGMGGEQAIERAEERPELRVEVLAKLVAHLPQSVVLQRARR